MLTFRPGQMRGFAASQEARFYDRLRAELHGFAAHLDADRDTGETDRHITHVFGLCRHYRMETEQQITRLSYILLAFPPEFYHSADYGWLHDILCTDRPADARLDRIDAVIEAS